MPGGHHAHERGHVVGIGVVAVDGDVGRARLTGHHVTRDPGAGGGAALAVDPYEHGAKLGGGGLGDDPVPGRDRRRRPPTDWTMRGVRRIPPLAIAE